MEKINQDGWLQDPDKYWILRFHKDQSSWIKQEFIFVDKGRLMPGKNPALLKGRKRMIRNDAIKLWGELRNQGWQRVGPQW